MITLYTYAKCSTCRGATNWLRDREIAFIEKPIRETPPSTAELRTMLEHVDGNVRRLFNTSGRDYRAAGLKDQLDAMPCEDALRLLETNGNLVKRPFLLGPGVGLVGFDEDAWSRALNRR